MNTVTAAPASLPPVPGHLTVKDVSDLSAVAECYREAIALKLADHPLHGRDALCSAETLLRHAAMTLMQTANYLDDYMQLMAHAEEQTDAH
jgi:hypothetical protein